MSYHLHAPTTDPIVLALRKSYKERRRQLNQLDSRLAELMPTPLCRLCIINGIIGPFDWTVCGPCWNKHNGKPPPQQSGAQGEPSAEPNCPYCNYPYGTHYPLCSRPAPTAEGR